MKKENILGVNIDDVPLGEATDILANWLKSGKKHYVVTPNPEFIMAAQSDSEFKEILNKADLAIPDGVGLKLSGGIKHTTTGIDLMEALCKISAEKNFTVGFLGGKNGVVKKAAERLRKKYHKLKIIYAETGPNVDKNGDQISLPQSNKYQKLRVDILFVGFGAVKQEKWIAKNLDQLPVSIAIGIGGAFDFLSGSVLRAPRWIRKIGLEWLFRLILQPWRIKRQFQLLKFIWFSFYS